MTNQIIYRKNDEILKLNRTEMLENKKINKRKRLLEFKLSKIFMCRKTHLALQNLNQI